MTLPQQAIEGLRNNPQIAYIESDAKVMATGMNYEEIPWGVDRIDDGIGIVQTHTYNTGIGAKVAIVDTGIYYNHPDLATNYAGGWDFVNNDDDPLDDNGHGTHVAGTIAAVSNNGIGVIGVAPNAELYSLKVLDSSGSGSISDIIAAIEWAMEHDIDIISMSLGSQSDDIAFHTISDAAYSEGVLLVAAAGNDYARRGKAELNTVDYPARYSSVIAVGATTQNDERASFSSTGPAVELAAPGEYILSTFNPTIPIEGETGYWYAIASGTSMATPHVSGAAALVLAGEPSLTNAQVRQRLIDTADDLGTTGFDNWFGNGIVDIDEAAPPIGPIPNQPPVANAGEDQTVMLDEGAVTASVTLYGSGSYDPDGDSLTFEWSEGGTYLGSGVSFDHLFNAGEHIVTLTVTDDQEQSDQDTVTITVKQYQKVIALDAIIDMGINSLPGGRVSATATITVSDENGNPIEGATVSGHWSIATQDIESGQTDSNGQVQLTSDVIKTKTSATFTFTIDNIVKTGYTFNSPLTETISYP